MKKIVSAVLIAGLILMFSGCSYNSPKVHAYDSAVHANHYAQQMVLSKYGDPDNVHMLSAAANGAVSIMESKIVLSDPEVQKYNK